MVRDGGGREGGGGEGEAREEEGCMIRNGCRAVVEYGVATLWWVDYIARERERKKTVLTLQLFF